MNPELEQQVLAKTWFYRFDLPGGGRTRSYDDGALDEVHSTRLAMMDIGLREAYASLEGRSAVDLACHQGYFATELARRGCDPVLAIDARAEHVADADLIARTLGLPQVRAIQRDVHEASDAGLGQHDIVLCFGLIYHLEDPVGALRVARSLCKGACLVETQVVPNMGGPVDWGSYRFVKPLKGVFGIIDETYETHGPEASVTGICLAPSTEGLLWCMEAVGFRNVHLIKPPDGAYEQHRYGKRVMAIGYV